MLKRTKHSQDVRQEESTRKWSRGTTERHSWRRSEISPEERLPLPEGEGLGPGETPAAGGERGWGLERLPLPEGRGPGAWRDSRCRRGEGLGPGETPAAGGERAWSVGTWRTLVAVWDSLLL